MVRTSHCQWLLLQPDREQCGLLSWYATGHKGPIQPGGSYYQWLLLQPAVWLVICTAGNGFQLRPMCVCVGSCDVVTSAQCGLLTMQACDFWETVWLVLYCRNSIVCDMHCRQWLPVKVHECVLCLQCWPFKEGVFITQWCFLANCMQMRRHGRWLMYIHTYIHMYMKGLYTWHLGWKMVPSAVCVFTGNTYRCPSVLCVGFYAFLWLV